MVDRPDGRWVRTKGDANVDEDPTLLPASAIVGRSQLVIPLVGYLIVLLSVPAGVLFLIGLAASLIAGAWLLESVEPAAARGAGALQVHRPVRGEPIAARPVSQPPAAVPSGRVMARPTIPEQLARSRETRARRARWGAASLRHHDRPRA